MLMLMLNAEVKGSMMTYEGATRRPQSIIAKCGDNGVRQEWRIG
jgi:hypothetical protein